MHPGIDTTQELGPSSGGARASRVSHLCDSLTSARSVLLVGAQGLGKSHTADAVVRVLRTRGVDALRIRGSASAHRVDFGAVLHQSTLSLTGAIVDDEPITATLLLRHAIRLGGSGPPVIVADDAHLLDAATMGCLYRLCSDGSLAVLFTADPLPGVSADVSDNATIRMLDELWMKGGAERIDLEPMSAQEASELVREFAPGETFDLITRAQLRQSSGGSRVLLRELTSEAMRQVRGPEPWGTDAVPSVHATGRIREMLAHQLKGLNPSQVALLALTYTVTGLSHSRSLMLMGREDLRNLIQAGFLTRPADADLLRVNELLGEAAMLACDSAVLTRLTGRLVHLLLTDRDRGVSTTAAESLLICDEWIEFGELRAEVVTVWGPDTVSDVLLLAARSSGSIGDAAEAVLYSWIAGQIRPDLRSIIEHSRALAADHRVKAAHAWLSGAADLLRTPADAVQLAQWQLALARTSSATPADITALVAEEANWFAEDAAMCGELAFADLTVSLQRLDWARVAADGETLSREGAAEIGTRVRAACLSGLASAHLGRGTEALALIDLAKHHNQADRRQRDSNAFSSEALALKIFLYETRVRCLTGLDVGALSTELQEWVERAVRGHDTASFAMLSLIAAHLAGYRGDLARTESELRRAESHFSRSDPEGWLGSVQAQHAAALARLGHVDAARAKMARVNAFVHPAEHDAFLRHETDQAQLAILIHAGNIDAALQLARQLQDGVAARAPMLRAELVQIFLQLGEPAEDFLDSPRVSDATTAVPSVAASMTASATDAPLLRALNDQVRAVAARDAVALDRSAARFAGLGAFGRAALASDDAALIYTEQGNRAGASLSSARTEAYAAVSTGRPAPHSDPHGAGRALTGREKQVTALAAQGLSNRDIAAALFLSVRTVESHLYKARVKTGDRPRGDDAGSSVPLHATR